ncbi:MAG: cardiolipin synthase [Dysgonamonadaceae bacterium]|jgi:cardiolipin synthase|nr:cardiolipin synthase [Dysgonamonadaceae bacterium]
MSQFLVYLLQILYAITVVGMIIVIISENRNPIKTVSWILVIMFLPVIGLLFYLIVGQDITKKQVISKRMYSKLKKRPLDEVCTVDEVNPPEGYEQLVKLLKNLDHTSLLGGNDLQFYTNGKDHFEALLSDIDRAKKHIHIEYYIFEDDKLGNRVKEALIRKAEEGLKIRVIYDSFGSRHTKKRFFEDMRKAGIEVESFLKLVMPIITSRLNYRNHRKIVVIDGQIGYVGGMNIADRYVDGASWGPWRDTQVRIEGKGVQGLQSIFLIDWYFVSQTLITSRKYFPVLDVYGSAAMQMVDSGPFKEEWEISNGVLQAIYNAKKSIFIQTPYFLPPDNMVEALQAAAVRGVDVRIMLSKRSDMYLVQRASFSFVKEMLLSGVKVYLYKNGFLHSKMMIFDDMLTLVGSVNFDFRSFESNFEVEAFIYDEEKTAEAKNIFLADQRNADIVSLREWLKRPKMRRFFESFMRLFAPLL